MEHIISVEAVNDLHTFILVCSCGIELTDSDGDGLESTTLAVLNEMAREHIETVGRGAVCICGHGKDRHPHDVCIVEVEPGQPGNGVLGHFADACMSFRPT